MESKQQNHWNNEIQELSPNLSLSFSRRFSSDTSPYDDLHTSD